MGLPPSLSLSLAAALKAATQLAILVLFSNQVGVAGGAALVLALAICGPWFILCELGLRTVAISSPLSVHRSIWRVRILSSCCGVVPLLVFAVSWPGSAALLLVVVGSIKAIDGVTDILSATLQVLGRHGAVCGLQVLNLVCSLPGVWVLLELGLPGWQALTWSAAVSVGVAIAGFSLTLRRATCVQEARPARIVIAQGAPLGLSGVMAIAVVAVPQYFLAHRGTSEDLLLFGLLLYFVTGAELTLNGYLQVKQREYWEQKAKGLGLHRRTYVWTALRMSLGVMSLTALGLLLSRFVVFPVLNLPHAFGWLEAFILMGIVASSAFVFAGAAALYSAHRYGTSLMINGLSLCGTVAVCAATLAWVPLQSSMLGLLVGATARGLGFFGAPLLRTRRSVNA